MKKSFGGNGGGGGGALNEDGGVTVGACEETVMVFFGDKDPSLLAFFRAPVGGALNEGDMLLELLIMSINNL